MDNRIYIFDTTLRDGEQSPGASLNIKEKIEIARMLEALKVDVIEAGFPISSQGDFESVKQVAEHVNDVTVAGLARSSMKDVDVCFEALKFAKSARIHTFIATSDIHLKHKLKMTREEVFERAVKAVKHAKNYGVQVEFSAEDAARTDLDFLCKIVEGVIDAGCDVVNVPDTVGYALPDEYGNLVQTLFDKVSNIDKAIISVHCHNDLGLAVANTLAAINHGARQVECTINGLGERAGNAALEEVVMALKTRKKALNLTTNIDTKKIYKTSRLVSNLTGITVQRNKAIVGENAFAHEAGIHQHGVLANSQTYEIMTPESIGLEENNLVLGKHSGRHAFRDKLEKMGYSLDKEKIEELFLKLKDLADKKKDIFDEDIEALVEDEFKDKDREIIKLIEFKVTSGNKVAPKAIVNMEVNCKPDSSSVIPETFEESYPGSRCRIESGMTKAGMKEAEASGDGPVDAAFNAIEKIAGISLKLEDYKIRAISQGKDAMGEVAVKVSCNIDNEELVFHGRGTSTDIVEASIKAYVDAVNKILNRTK